MTTKYRTIVADPPWHYEGFAGSVGYGGHFAGTSEQARVEVRPLPYASMSLDEIRALPVDDLAATDCRLFLWTTSRYLPDAFPIGAGWGFGYRQTITWHKTSNVPPFGGSVTPNRAEFLLVFQRGTPGIATRWSGGSVVSAPKPNAEHSRKPDVFIDLVEQVSPGPYLELFARRARFGWDYWGDESLGTAELPEAAA